jgi:two-component system chemotaxis response regulator CheB
MMAAPAPPRPARATPEVVLVGGSAGSLEPLSALAARLPPDWPVPVVVVVHLPPAGPSALAAALAAETALAVTEIEDKQPLAAGTIHVGPPGYHVLVDEGPVLSLAVDEPVHFSIPSIDVLFESAAATCGDRAVGVILSGASEDGASGLAAIRAAGGTAVVQAPGDAQVPLMPRAALGRCPDATVLPGSELAAFLRTLIPGGPR